MVYYLLVRLKSELGPNFPQRLIIHCDNCYGQNRNQFTLWFYSWLKYTGIFKETWICFLLAGHTKNEFDGTFGCIKRRLKKEDVFCCEDMRLKVIENCKHNLVCISAPEVIWFRWKDYLSEHFAKPAKFKLTQFHQF